MNAHIKFVRPAKLSNPRFVEAFWSRVDKTPGHGPKGECWLWNGAIQRGCGGGYGLSRCDGKTQRSHRVSWQIAKGPIPEGLQVLHKCDVRACTNPDHLFIGTNKDNVDDKVRKGRHPRGELAAQYSNPKRGEQNCHAKFSESQIHEFRTLYAKGMAIKDIADRFGEKRHVVNMIVHGKRWAHIPGAVPPQRRMAKQYLDEIRTLKASGVSQRSIAAQLNFSEAAISRVISV